MYYPDARVRAPHGPDSSARCDVSFGNAAMIRGPALLTKGLRLWILEELGAARTFSGDDFARLPEGEPVIREGKCSSIR